MSTWLVTGATGLLGSNAAVQLKLAHKVVGVARSVPTISPIAALSVDLSDERARKGLVERAEADVVLHSAAISSISACEEDPKLAYEVNVAASADIAGQARACGARFVYISSDAVFSGESGGYSESDEPSPTTEYGRSKLAGERAVLEVNPDALIARVNFYGWSPDGRRSLAEFFYHRLQDGQQVPGFNDVKVSTLYVGHLVELLEALVNLRAKGLFNVVSSEPTSKYEFGRRLARTFGFAEELVFSAQSSDHLAIKRGSRLNLSTDKVESLLGAAPAGQQEGMDRLLADRRSGRVQAVASFRAG